MRGIVLTVSDVKKSKIKEGNYVEATFRICDGILMNQSIRFFCDLKHTKSSRFYPYLKPQAVFEKLEVMKKNNEIFIDGNSDFLYIGIKGQIK